jgi:hypothetical protein
LISKGLCSKIKPLTDILWCRRFTLCRKGYIMFWRTVILLWTLLESQF